MFNHLVLHPQSRKQSELLVQSLPHGVIIDGPSGIGVTAAAHAIADAVGAHTFVIQPKKRVKSDLVVDPKEGSVVIDDIRQLYAQTRTKQPKKHIYIIDAGERPMTPAAQNAFLKLLEEPRDNLHFIIASHHRDQLLPTIISRTQSLSLQPVTDDQTKLLIENIGVSDATKIARLSFVGRGLPALIKRLNDDEKEYESRVAIMGDAKTMLSGTVYDKLSVVHRYRDNRPSSLTLIEDMNYQLKTIVRSKPDQKLVADIDKYLGAWSRINAGGNIRLQLAAAVL